MASGNRPFVTGTETALHGLAAAPPSFIVNDLPRQAAKSLILLMLIGESPKPNAIPDIA
jgi:hypothetical protein